MLLYNPDFCIHFSLEQVHTHTYTTTNTSCLTRLFIGDYSR